MSAAATGDLVELLSGSGARVVVDLSRQWDGLEGEVGALVDGTNGRCTLLARSDLGFVRAHLRAAVHPVIG